MFIEGSEDRAAYNARYAPELPHFCNDLRYKKALSLVNDGEARMATQISPDIACPSHAECLALNPLSVQNAPFPTN